MKFRYASSFDIAGTKSFRLSARKLFGDTGGNVQQVPEELRQYFTADPGKSIVQVDQSGAEALVVAYLAEPGNYRQLFDVGIKPHPYLALNIFVDKFRGSHPKDRYQFKTPAELIDLPEWPKLNKFISKDDSNADEYALGKMTAHAKSYNMGPKTFRLAVLQRSKGRIVLSLAEAKNFLNMFEKLFPEVIEWQGRLITQVSQDRKLYNLFNYPRGFFGRWSTELQREALSYIPQSTIGCLTSITFTELFNYALANSLNWDLLFNVHDAVVAQVPTADIQHFTTKCQQLFSRPIPAPYGTITMKSEAMAGPCWMKSKMTEVKAQ